MSITGGRTSSRLPVSLLLAWASAVWLPTTSVAQTVLQPVGLTVAEQLPQGIAGRDRTAAETVTLGIPFSDAEALADSDGLVISDAGGTALQSQFRVLRRYPSGHIQWLLTDFATSLAAGQSRTFQLTDTGAPVARGADLATADSAASRIVVDTGAASFAVATDCFRGLEQVTLDNGEPGGVALLDPARAPGVYIRDADGTLYSSANDCTAAVSIEENGPVRAVVKIEGVLRDGGGVGSMRYGARLTFTHGSAAVRHRITLKNAGLTHRAAREYLAGGLGLALADDGNGFAYRYADDVDTVAGNVALVPAADPELPALVQSLTVQQGHPGTDPTASGWTLFGDRDCYNWTPPLPGQCVGSQYTYDEAYQGLLLGADGAAPAPAAGRLYTEGWLSASGAAGPGVTAVLRHMTAKMGSSMTLDAEGRVWVNNLDLPQPFVQHWGGHESFTVLLAFFPEAASHDPRAGWYALQYPLRGRAGDFGRYQDSGAFFGQTRLATLAEQSAVWSEIGESEPNVSRLTNTRQTFTHIVHQRRNYYEVYDDFLDYLRSGYGGSWHHALEHTELLADRAVVHSDDFNFTAYPDTSDIPRNPANAVGFNPFDGGHAESLGFYPAYYLTGDEWLREAIIDYAENQLRDQNANTFAIPQTIYWRPWMRRIRNLALAYDFTGEALYLQPVLDGVDYLIDTVADGTLNDNAGNGRGRDRDRGFLYMLSQGSLNSLNLGQQRVIHAFFGTQIAGDTWPYVLRVLRGLPDADSDAQRRRLRDFEDLLLGTAQFVCNEAIRYDTETYGFPDDYLLDNPNIWELPQGALSADSLSAAGPPASPPGRPDLVLPARFDYKGQTLDYLAEVPEDLSPGQMALLDDLYQRGVGIGRKKNTALDAARIDGSPQGQYYYAYLISFFAGLLYDMNGDASCLRPALNVSYNKMATQAGQSYGAKLQQQALFHLLNRDPDNFDPEPARGWVDVPLQDVIDEGGGQYTLVWQTPADAHEYRLKYAGRNIVDWLWFDQLSRLYVWDPSQYLPFTSASNIGKVVPVGPPGGEQRYTVTLSPSDPAEPHFALRYRPAGAHDNRSPQVDAGADQHLATLSATLTGSASDSDGPEDLLLDWSVASGPGAVSFSAAADAVSEVQVDTPGVYRFRLNADDGRSIVYDEVVILLGNQPPAVDAGEDQQIDLSTSVELSGAVSDDGLGVPLDTLQIDWSGPGQVTFTDASAAVTRASFSEPGQYRLVLSVSDGLETVQDTVTITVNLADQAAYWPLDDDQNGSGLAHDDIGGNHLTLVGAQWQSGAGYAGDALAFDGSAYAERADADLSVLMPGQSASVITGFTAALWINPSDLSVKGPLLAKHGNLATGVKKGFVLSAGDGEGGRQLYFEINRGDGRKDLTEVWSGQDLTEGQWQHVAVTYDFIADGSSVVRLYVDGQPAGEHTAAVGPLQRNPQPLTLGYYRLSGREQNYFSGLLDEAKVFSRALDATEIQTLVAGGGPVNQPPTASLTPASASGEAPLAVDFDAGGSSDPDGTIVGYAWDFGDGASDDTSAVTVGHTYTAPGSYTVTLTVTDDDGASAFATAAVTVDEPGAVNEPPAVILSATPDSGAAPLAVDFDASGSSDPDGDTLSYAWDFGDGATATGVTASHTYQKQGNYTATLTVTDAQGASAGTTVRIRVRRR